MKKNNINFFFINIVLTVMFNLSYSQSGWDICYNHVNKLNDSLIGQQIFLDLKIDDSDIVKYNLENCNISGVAKNVRVNNIELLILEKNVIYREDYRIYDDMGYLNDQRYTNKKNNKEFIKDIYLVKIVGDTICLKANLYNSKEDFTPIEFEVLKDKVKGFLTRM